MEIPATRICRICNQEKNIERFPKSKVKGKIYYRYDCTTCIGRKTYAINKSKLWHKEMIVKQRIKYKEKDKERNRIWKKNNPDKAIQAQINYVKRHGKEKISAYRKSYYEANKKTFIERAHKFKVIYQENLSDSYIRECIVNNNRLLSAKDIPQQLVEIKRKQLKLYRDAKKAKTNNN